MNSTATRNNRIAPKPVEPLTDAEKARLKFTLETAPNGLGVDRLLSAIRGAGGGSSIDSLNAELERMAAAGECRKFAHPLGNGTFMYGCNVGEGRD